MCGAKRPSLPWKGRWLSVSETGGVCASPECENPSVSPFGLPPLNSGMIATGNHNFERFAALCNTLSGEPRALRAVDVTAFKMNKSSISAVADVDNCAETVAK